MSGLKLDGGFDGTQSQFVVQHSGIRWRICNVFITNCVRPSVFICMSGALLFLIFILLLSKYDYVCLLFDSLCAKVCVCVSVIVSVCLVWTSN